MKDKTYMSFGSKVDTTIKQQEQPAIMTLQ